MFAEFDEKTLKEPVTLKLTVGDVLMLRAGLENLVMAYSRHEHIIPDIERLLERLPTPEELKRPLAA